MGGTAEWVTIKEGAAYGESSPYMIRRAIELGELTAYRIGGRIMIRREDIDKWNTPQPIKLPKPRIIDLPAR